MSKVHVDLLERTKAEMAKEYALGLRPSICRCIPHEAPSVKERRQIKSYIEECIEPWSYASGWLFNELYNGKYSNDDLNEYLAYDEWYSKNRYAIYEWRLRWIDQMIEIFRNVE